MDEKEAASLFRRIRWEEQIYCVHCASARVIKNGLREDYIQQYRCKSCEKSFNDRSKTVLSDTRMSVLECFRAIFMDKKGLSTSKISKEINRSWKTVDKFLKLQNQSPDISSVISEFEEARSIDIDYSKIGCGSNPQFS